ncbi:MAG TPA: hypothetical protein VFU29_07570 [Chitinophagaceae bacterium]|nr:hypothetical protein [Chitinophagaceae bacterium]
MRRKKLPYSIRLIRVSLKWTWRALIMIPKEIIFGTPIRKKERQYR